MELLEERLAKLWMTGVRKSIPPGGIPRAAWEHPLDLVKVIQSELIRTHPTTVDYLIRLAWLHDLLEDGSKPDGSRVTDEDLWFAGVDSQLVEDVVDISRRQGEEKNEYLARLISTPTRVRLVKCIDRACVLREAPKKSAGWWDEYSASTRKYILPLARSLSTKEGLDTWAVGLLEHALTLRPSRRMHQVLVGSPR